MILSCGHLSAFGANEYRTADEPQWCEECAAWRDRVDESHGQMLEDLPYDPDAGPSEAEREADRAAGRDPQS